MIKLSPGDKVAIVSTSSGILGEPFCTHQIALGKERLEALGLEVVFMPHALKGLDFVAKHPEKRVEDLMAAFKDPSIKGIIAAIGGFDSALLAPFLLTPENKALVSSNPKFFMGFSDTTMCHLMLRKLGLNSFYGLSFLTCFAELGKEMLPYSKESFQQVFSEQPFTYQPSPIYYEERTDFSVNSVGTERVQHQDPLGWEILRRGEALAQGEDLIQGQLFIACIESLYYLTEGNRFPKLREINKEYKIIPEGEEAQLYLKDSLLVLETCEEKPEPALLKKMLENLVAKGFFAPGLAKAILVGKPQDNCFYEEYKEVFLEVIPPHVGIFYNFNIGHAYPKMILQYGAQASLNLSQRRLEVERI